MDGQRDALLVAASRDDDRCDVHAAGGHRAELRSRVGPTVQPVFNARDLRSIDVTAKPVFFGVVSTKSDPIAIPERARGRARNTYLPHTGESGNVAGRTREYRGGLWDRSGRSDHAGQKPATTGQCRERRWQKASSWALLLKESAARYEADNATGPVPLSPMQRSPPET
jgi:hypothetical protein